jgi:hypothetical protein
MPWASLVAITAASVFQQEATAQIEAPTYDDEEMSTEREL